MGNVNQNDSFSVQVAENGFVVTAWVGGEARTIVAVNEDELIGVIMDLVGDGEESDEADEIESTN